jgi:hypothetical protein
MLRVLVRPAAVASMVAAVWRLPVLVRLPRGAGRILAGIAGCTFLSSEVGHGGSESKKHRDQSARGVDPIATGCVAAVPAHPRAAAIAAGERVAVVPSGLPGMSRTPHSPVAHAPGLRWASESGGK